MGHMGVGLEPLAPPRSALAKIGGRINITMMNIRDRVGQCFVPVIKPARWNAAPTVLTISASSFTIRWGAYAGAASPLRILKKFRPNLEADAEIGGRGGSKNLR